MELEVWILGILGVAALVGLVAVVLVVRFLVQRIWTALAERRREPTEEETREDVAQAAIRSIDRLVCGTPEAGPLPGPNEVVTLLERSARRLSASTTALKDAERVESRLKVAKSALVESSARDSKLAAKRDVVGKLKEEVEDLLRG